MNSSLDYLKNIFKVIIWPILFGIGQFTIIVIFTLIFNTTLKLDNDVLSAYMETESYHIELSKFLNDNKLIIALLTTLIFLPIFIKTYKKYKQKKSIKLTVKDISLFSLLGISICFIFNIIVYYLNNIWNFTNLYSERIVLINLVITIICTGILGPILEEYLFRGIVYNKLKKFNTKYNSMIITSLIFALLHNNYVNIIYAFLISLILTYVYEKYQTIKAPIIIHMVANTSVILFLDLITDNGYIMNTMLLLGMSFILFIVLKNIFKREYIN